MICRDSASTVTLTFALYLLALLCVGLWASKRSGKNIGAFFLGGRTLGSFVVALSAVVSGRSSWLILGVTGAAFLNGFSAVWVLPGYILAELFMFVFVAPRIRRYTEKRDCITLPDYFEARFHDEGKYLRILSVAMILVFFTTYIGAQLTAGTKTFQATFGLNSFDGTALITVIIALYTISGGFLAVSINDAVQACLMLLGLVVMPAVGLWNLGGFDALLAKLSASSADGNLLAVGASFAIIKGLAIGTGSFGQPHILARYMSISKASQLKASALIGTIWNVLMGWGAIWVGLIGRAMYQSRAALPLQDQETLFIKMAADTFHPVVLGLLVSAVVAAILSTVDSQLLVAASGAARDIYNKLTRDGAKATPKELVWASRFFVLLVLFAAFLLGIYAKQSDNEAFQNVFNFVLQAWYGLGCAFGPIIVMSLFWRSASKEGALACMIFGPSCVFLGLLTNGFASFLGKNSASILRPEVVGFFGGVLLILAFGSLYPPPEKVRREIDEMSN